MIESFLRHIERLLTVGNIILLTKIKVLYMPLFNNVERGKYDSTRQVKKNNK